MKFSIKNYFTQVSYENIDLIPIWKIPLINNFLLEGLFDFFGFISKPFSRKFVLKVNERFRRNFNQRRKLKFQVEECWNVLDCLRAWEWFSILTLTEAKIWKRAMAQWLEQSLAEQDDPGSFPAAPFRHVFLPYCILWWGKNW